MIQDLRFSLRLIRRHAVSSVASILVIALAVGASTVVFSWVKGVLLNPLPFPKPDQLYSVRQVIPPQGEIPGRIGLLPENVYWEWKRTGHTLEGLAIYGTEEVGVGLGSGPRAILSATVSPGFFEVLGVRPVRGRGFYMPESRDEPAPVVLSHGLALELFGGIEGVLGDEVRIDGKERSVAGVMPAGFDFPDPAVRLWLPVERAEIQAQEAIFMRSWNALARLRQTSPAIDAEREVEEVARGLEGTGPNGIQNRSFLLRPLRQEIVEEVRPGLLALLGAVSLLVMVAAANVAGLVLSRQAARAREFATRAALGARRFTMIRLVLVESAVLGIAGAVGGVVLATLTHGIWLRWLPSDLPRIESVELDAGALSVGAALAFVLTLLFGIWPALRTRIDFDVLRSGKSSSKRRRNIARWLVTGEAALAVVLVVLATFLVRSFDRLMEVDAGFAADSTLTAELDLDLVASHPESSVVFDEIIERVQTLSAVQSTGLVKSLPLASGFSMTMGRRVDRPNIRFRASQQWTSPGYRRAQGLEMISGRWITEEDHRFESAVAVINQALVDKAFAGTDPLHRRIDVRGIEVEVVGIVKDVRLFGQASDVKPMVYMSHRLEPGTGPSSLWIVIRTQDDPLLIVPTLRTLVSEVVPHLPLGDVATMESRLSGSVAHERFFTLLASAFGILALFLSAAAIFALVNHSVNQERRKIGIQRALGAMAGDVLRSILTRELLHVVLGTIIGLLLAWHLREAATHLLFGIESTNLGSYVLALSIFLVVALVACLVPIQRALAIEPAEVLRHE